VNKAKALPRLVLLVAGYIGLINFLRGVFFVIWAAIVIDSLSTSIQFLLPYLAITALFGGACFLGHYRRLSWATVLLSAAVLGFVAMYIYDVNRGRYQIHSTGQGVTYFFWWWYRG